ncbi:hypothetical protein [Serratia sp. CY76391]
METIAAWVDVCVAAYDDVLHAYPLAVPAVMIVAVLWFLSRHG